MYRPLMVGGRVTPAALFRAVEMYAPTLLLDEADTYLGDAVELHGIVNGSQRRSSAYVLRCLSDDEHEPRRFGTWCAKAIAGIRGLPDTVLDRSIVIRLERRSPDVSLASWRDRDRAIIEDLKRKLLRWTTDNRAMVVAGLSTAAFPDGLNDRERDAWAAFLAIGEVAGGQWRGQNGLAWQACQHVTSSAVGEEAGVDETLLADLRDVFEAKGFPDGIPTGEILYKLTSIDGRRWGEWSRGKPLSAHGLARLLKPFGVKPRQMRLDNRNLKCYLEDELCPVWERYLPDSPAPPETETKHRNKP